MRTYWKVSTFDDKVGGYIVREVNLKEYEAKDLVKKLESMGCMARASKHINKKGEYYYGK